MWFGNPVQWYGGGLEDALSVTAVINTLWELCDVSEGGVHVIS